MTIKKERALIEIEFGKRLKHLRIKRKFNTIEDFGKAFNNGKVHKDFSSYEKGKNVQFRTMVKFAYLLKTTFPSLLDFDNINPIDLLDKNKTFDELAIEALKVFSTNIKKLRKEKFKNQLDFEMAIGMNRENIANYELGKIKPTLITIERFASAFGINSYELFIDKI